MGYWGAQGGDGLRIPLLVLIVRLVADRRGGIYSGWIQEDGH